MKVLSIPSSGKIGQVVAYQSPFGNCQRQYCIPANPKSPAQQHTRAFFTRFARAWSQVLTQAQRDAWNVAGPKVQSATRLGSGPLTGQQLFQGLNSARACIGHRGILLLPTAQIVFGVSGVDGLTITNGQSGVRLLLKVTGPVTEEVMVFGQAPCSAGRSKRRNVAYLGLLPVPQDGMSDITDIYVARYGEPRPGEKVFIVTRQQKDGWEDDDYETNEIVPEKPTEQQAEGTAALTLIPYMHKGCTRDAQGTSAMPVPCSPEGGKAGAQDGEAAVAGFGGGATRIPRIDTEGGGVGLQGRSPAPDQPVESMAVCAFGMLDGTARVAVRCQLAHAKGGQEEASGPVGGSPAQSRVRLPGKIPNFRLLQVRPLISLTGKPLDI